MADDYVAATQEIFSDLIKKPKLQDKYLRKPPFRFIHDIVMNTMKATGFPEGLYQGPELIGKGIKDKQSKISWLNKLIQCLESVTSESITVDPTKIVAGMEPECTNQMLQIFGSIAIDVVNGQLSMSQILENMNSGSSINKENDDGDPEADESGTGDSTKRSQQTQPDPSDGPPLSNSSHSTKSVKSPPTEPPPPSSTNHENKEQWLLDTQRTLGALIQRPRLLDKLLRRPPFRFLFDVIRSLIKATGFPLQFLDESSDITNADMKDAKFKFVFLSKLIVIASAVSNEDLSFIDPKQIIAGRHPEATNILLTRLAEAATATLDVDAIQKRIASIKQQQRDRKQKEQKEKEQKEREQKEEREKAQRQKDSKKMKSKKESQSRPTHRADTARKNAPIMPKLELEQLSNSTKPNPVKPVPLKLTETQNQNDDSSSNAQSQPFQAIQKLQRPRTARRAPPKLKSNVVEEDKGSELKNAVIIMDDAENEEYGGDGDDDAELEAMKETKEDSELQRLGFIDRIDDDRERSERVQGVDELENGADGDHGKLVRDILDAQSGIKLDSMKLGTHRKDSAKSMERMESMREMIQTLCQTCLPLGKCIDMVFQDVEGINTELMKWKQQIAANESKLSVERKETQRVLAPFDEKLKEIENEIKRQNQMILEKKAVLLRNEAKTSDIIRKRLLNE